MKKGKEIHGMFGNMVDALDRLNPAYTDSLIVTMKMLLAGETYRAALAAGNEILIAAGLKPLSYEEVKREAVNMQEEGLVGKCQLIGLES